MGSESECINFLCSLVAYPHLDNVFGEYVAFQEEIVVFFEAVERVFERSREARDFCKFFRSEFVNVLVKRLSGVDFVLDAVESSPSALPQRQGKDCMTGRGI